jgi:hypothetical protein
MPIHIDFNHASRLAVAVIRGSLSADDVRNAMLQFMAADARSYRKIIDVASPDTPLEGTDIEQIARMILSRPSTGSRGPLAFVVGPGQAAENAGMYAKLTTGGRPIKVFDSLPEAQKWLDENALPASPG